MTIDELKQDCGSRGTTIEERLHNILSRRFVKFEQVARAIALAIQSNQNVIFWGPAGHGKSEMVEEALRGLGLWEVDPDTNLPSANSNTFIQSFGEGLTEDQLWGGIDLRAMEEEKIIKYHPEHSFLAKEVAVFEEMFDAPAICLLPLKHTITQKVLAKGGIYYPMTTKSIIVCTNKNPEDLQAMGPSHHALVERFPIQLKVEWQSYNADDYASMMAYHKQAHMFHEDIINALAGIIATVSKEGTFISPRTAMWAMGLVAGAAKTARRDFVNHTDFFALEFCPGLEKSVDSIRDAMQREAQVAEAKRILFAVKSKLDVIEHVFGKGLAEPDRLSPIKWLQLSHHYGHFIHEASQTPCTDSMLTVRDQMVQAATERQVQCQRLALKHTKEGPLPVL